MAPSSGTASARVRIEGRVQGVGFRAWVEMEAVALGLRGWVRNRRDASVEASFHGDAATVAEMLRRCHRGPPAAVVGRVHVLPEDGTPTAGFSVLPTI